MMTGYVWHCFCTSCTKILHGTSHILRGGVIKDMYDVSTSCGGYSDAHVTVTVNGARIKPEFFGYLSDRQTRQNMLPLSNTRLIHRAEWQSELYSLLTSHRQLSSVVRADRKWRHVDVISGWKSLHQTVVVDKVAVVGVVVEVIFVEPHWHQMIIARLFLLQPTPTTVTTTDVN